MELNLLNSTSRRRLKETTSRCPVCLAPIPATVLEASGSVVMTKSCPEHGSFEVQLAADTRWYFESRGASAGAGSGAGSCCGGESGACCGSVVAGSGTPASSALGSTESASLALGTTEAAAPRDPFDTLSTCLALIEIVDDCNLACPACYASSPLARSELNHLPFDAFVARVRGVIARKGSIDILQLTGGEPTIHPEFERVLRWAVDEPAIGYVLINTNAVRLANDPPLREALGRLRRERKKFELYVQFDGPQKEGQHELRAADLRATRERAIDLCGSLGIPSTLAMVVTPATLPFLGETLRWGVRRPHVRGITFQPLFTSGRVPRVESSLPIAAAAPSHQPISVGDVVASLTQQSEGLLDARDFTPLPCGDPNCHTIGYLLRSDDGPIGLSRLIDLPGLQRFLRDRVNYSLSDLARCGCETEPLGSLLKQLEIGPERPFRLFVKPFMDAWTFDQDRIDRCCTHVIRQDGSLDSFCRYYLNGGAAGERARAQGGVLGAPGTLGAHGALGTLGTPSALGAPARPC